MQTDNLWNFYSIEEVLTMIKNAGFDAYDVTMCEMYKKTSIFSGEDYLEKAKEIRKVADRLGLVCNQSHAPYPLHRDNDEDFNANILGWVIKSLEVSSILGVKICVVHPHNDWTPEENKLYVYDKLLPYCKKFNVKVATENMWNWEADINLVTPCACSYPDNFNAHLDCLDKDWFCACLDVGHAQMFGKRTNALELMHALGGKIQALHIHDNDQFSDLHTFPFNGLTDWDNIIQGLKDINYSGDFTFETYSFVRNCPPEVKPEALNLLGAIGRYFVNRIQDKF